MFSDKKISINENGRPKVPGWATLGEGTYNWVYCQYDENDNVKWVLKIPKMTDSATDNPERSIRLWSLINPDLKPSPEIFRGDGVTGWIVPYIDGYQATDDEIQAELINIYNRTGRIIVDAVSPKNFVTVHPEDSFCCWKQSKTMTVCIDIGMALELEKRNKNRESRVSLVAWQQASEVYDKRYFNKFSNSLHYPLAINTIKALLYIKNSEKSIFDVNFLLKMDNLKLFAKAYDVSRSMVASESGSSSYVLIQKADKLLDKLLNNFVKEFIQETRDFQEFGCSSLVQCAGQSIAEEDNRFIDDMLASIEKNIQHPDWSKMLIISEKILGIIPDGFLFAEYVEKFNTYQNWFETTDEKFGYDLEEKPSAPEYLHSGIKP